MITETPSLQKQVQPEGRFVNLIKQEFIKHAKEINRLEKDVDYKFYTKDEVDVAISEALSDLISSSADIIETLEDVTGVIDSKLDKDSSEYVKEVVVDGQNIVVTTGDNKTSVNQLQIQIPDVPTKTSELINDSNYISKVYWKDVINKPILSPVATNGSYNDLYDLPVIPKKTSELINDSGYITGVSWDEVTDKPSTFPPSTHTHDYLPLSGGTLTGTLQLGESTQSQFPTTGIAVHDTHSVNAAPGAMDEGVNFFFSNNTMPNTNWWAGMRVKGWTGEYNAWEIVGAAHNSDQRTVPLYVRTSNKTTAWGSWRKIYDSSNKPTLSELGAAAASHKHANAADLSNNPRTIEFIEGTQTAATPSFTGKSGDSALYDGKVIAYYLPFAGTSAGDTLNLTLSNNTTTGAKPVWYRNQITRLTTHYPANTIILMAYDATNGCWVCGGQYNTTYSSMSATEATTGTAKTARLITAKVLHDEIKAIVNQAMTENGLNTI